MFGCEVADAIFDRSLAARHWCSVGRSGAVMQRRSLIVR